VGEAATKVSKCIVQFAMTDDDEAGGYDGEAAGA